MSVRIVSNVVRDTGRFSEARRQRVHRAADELGYRPGHRTVPRARRGAGNCAPSPHAAAGAGPPQSAARWHHTGDERARRGRGELRAQPPRCGGFGGRRTPRPLPTRMNAPEGGAGNGALNPRLAAPAGAPQPRSAGNPQEIVAPKGARMRTQPPPTRTLTREPPPPSTPPRTAAATAHTRQPPAPKQSQPPRTAADIA
ncbi:LacI family DNA-binding transcriptional regulator [Actinospica acidiphila]|uniref:LacI family DNA-binding transcriptional regulator n=1 Tax=Actinospica acidiphila TaxID=304899 RepID=A0A9X5CM75_9ACTN|nr:LacI family DNA-binding transcriptional regulator [Actinospica acidiphila]